MSFSALAACPNSSTSSEMKLNTDFKFIYFHHEQTTTISNRIFNYIGLRNSSGFTLLNQLFNYFCWLSCAFHRIILDFGFQHVNAQLIKHIRKVF